MVPALACIKWFDCHLPGAVVSQGNSWPNAKNSSGFPPPTRQSTSIEAELLGLTSIYSEWVRIMYRYTPAQKRRKFDDNQCLYSSEDLVED